MRRNRKTLLIAIALMLALVLSGCGGSETSNKAKKIEYKDAKLKIEETGWSYSKTEGVIYYAVKVKNESAVATCLYPDMDIKLKDGNNKTVADESVKLPKIAPGETVTYASVGPELSYAPNDVKFSFDKELLDWEEDANIQKDKTALSVASCGVRAGESESNSDILSGFDSGMSEMNEFLRENGSSQSYDTTVEDEANDNDGKQYYGVIHNNNDCTYDAVVIIVYRDGSGNLIGGENTTVSGIKNKSDIEFTLSSFNDVSTGNYEVLVYPW